MAFVDAMVVLLVYDRCNLKEASCLLTVATVHGTEGRLDDALRVAKARVQTVTKCFGSMFEQ